MTVIDRHARSARRAARRLARQLPTLDIEGVARGHARAPKGLDLTEPGLCEDLRAG